MRLRAITINNLRHRGQQPLAESVSYHEKFVEVAKFTLDLKALALHATTRLSLNDRFPPA
jgi:hypothetical protein